MGVFVQQMFWATGVVCMVCGVCTAWWCGVQCGDGLCVFLPSNWGASGVLLDGESEWQLLMRGGFVSSLQSGGEAVVG